MLSDQSSHQTCQELCGPSGVDAEGWSSKEDEQLLPWPYARSQPPPAKAQRVGKEAGCCSVMVVERRGLEGPPQQGLPSLVTCPKDTWSEPRASLIITENVRYPHWKMLRLNCRAASIAIFRHHYPHWRLLCRSFHGILFRYHYPHWRLLCRSFHGILFILFGHVALNPLVLELVTEARLRHCAWA
ncbi:unnamed protein product [Boreogadus saida]